MALIRISYRLKSFICHEGYFQDENSADERRALKDNLEPWIPRGQAERGDDNFEKS